MRALVSNPRLAAAAPTILVLAALAVGGAAVAGLSLMRTMPAWVLVAGAALPVLLVGLPVVVVAVRRGSPAAPDRLDRSMLRLAVWLAVSGGGSALTSAFFRDSARRSLGTGGLTLGLQALALWMGAALAAAVVVRVRRAPPKPGPGSRDRLFAAALLASSLGAGAVALSVSWLRHAGSLAEVEEIALGGYHVCARRRDGSVVCWGSNEEGQLGDGGTEDSKFPVLVRGVHDAARIVAGTQFTCALHRDRRVSCWGEIAEGLGSETAVTNALFVAAGPEYACAWLEDERLLCWGRAGHADRWRPPYEVGRAPLPVEILAVGPVIDMAAANEAVCLRRAGGLDCRWPHAVEREEGRTCIPQWQAPADRAPLEAGALVAHEGRICEVDAKGSVICWGEIPMPGPMGGVPTCAPSEGKREPIEARARRVAFDHASVCVIDDQRRVRCWDYQQQRGEPWLERATGIAMRLDTTCAVRDDGTVWCWGDYNDFGQHGDGTRRASASPVQVRH